MRSEPPLPPRRPGEPRLLDAKELSVFFGIHHKTIYGWVTDEILTPPAYTRVRRLLRFDRVKCLEQLQRQFPDKFPGL